MIKNKNKKIAIIGTSPIMLLLYFKLKKRNFIDVFEASDLGGAWRIDKIDGQNYTTHNNVIVALNEEEEKYLKQMGMLTAKPVLYVCNVNENDAANGNSLTEKVKEMATVKQRVTPSETNTEKARV